MNIILQLFDQAYVADLFNRQILPLYPDFKTIKSIDIKPVKKNVWATTYHVVIEFSTVFLTRAGEETSLPIYVTAHSDEPRLDSFKAMEFLWRHGFEHGDLTMPRPLFFSDYFNGYFYRGVEGHNLYHYIKQPDKRAIEDMIPKVAAWFAKLHRLSTGQAKNFNQLNSRMATVIPGHELIFDKLRKNYPEHHQSYKQAFEFVKGKETAFLDGRKKLWLIHGDAHPENVIKMSANTTAVIDFTDICLADFARDLGAFLQQFEFMSSRKQADRNYIEKIKKLFLASYFDLSGEKFDDSARERINYYHAWTALRTASLFLLKENPEPERAHALLAKARQDLRL